MEIYVNRFKPDTDLKQEIVKFAQEKSIQAGFILTCVGSLKQACLRFANQSDSVCFKEYFEVISLTGTVTASQGIHLHIGIADEKGRVMGGHLMDGNIIYTTIEVAIANLPAYIFRRELDATFGYRELVVEKVPLL